MQHPKTVKVKPWGKGQGDFVLINEDDMTEAHELYEAPAVEVATEDRKADRAAMFALLRENGVSVAKNSTDDALRAKVEEIKAGKA